jgi:hypothetical protein
MRRKTIVAVACTVAFSPALAQPSRDIRGPEINIYGRGPREAPAREPREPAVMDRSRNIPTRGSATPPSTPATQLTPQQIANALAKLRKAESSYDKVLKIISIIALFVDPQIAAGVAVARELLSLYDDSKTQSARQWWTDRLERAGVCPGCGFQEKFLQLRREAESAKRLIDAAKANLSPTPANYLSASLEALSTQFGEFQVRNTCGEPIWLTILYQTPGGEWTSIGRYDIPTGQEAKLTSRGKRLISANSIFYVYGGSESHSWRGSPGDSSSVARNLNGNTVHFMQIKAPRTENSDWLVLPCA